MIPPSFADVSIATAYPSWDAIAEGADLNAVSGLGDEGLPHRLGDRPVRAKGTVVVSTTVADMIVTNKDDGDFDVDPAADRAKAVALARLVLDKLP